ncbi:hypothetical protein V6N11_019072 [Hibiscus sabdariffa]|uniref:DRBM domain-containing protein n=1 Tax=Hibiscus sabdariffa TaxID=183260 RepID=A0ABR2R1F8_9ROSI
MVDGVSDTKVFEEISLRTDKQVTGQKIHVTKEHQEEQFQNEYLMGIEDPCNDKDSWDRCLNSDASNSKNTEFSLWFHHVSCEGFKNFKIFSVVESELAPLLKELTSSDALWSRVSCQRAYELSSTILDPQLIAKVRSPYLITIERDEVGFTGRASKVKGKSDVIKSKVVVALLLMKLDNNT